MNTFSTNIPKFIKKLKSNKQHRKQIISFAFEENDIDFYSVLYHLKKSSELYFYSSTPASNIKFIGIGSILNISEQGTNRVINTSNKIISLNLLHITNFDEFSLSSVPLFLGGMKFSPDSQNTIWSDYNDSDWFIPAILVFQHNFKKYVIFNFYSETLTEEDFEKYNNRFNIFRKHRPVSDLYKECTVLNTNYDDPMERIRWIEQVRSALSQIKAGDYHKIVLSRQVISELNCQPDFSHIMEELERKFPRCYIFAFRKDSSVFFGASPEKLAKISDGWVEADALAGSIRRGDTESEDIELANELLNSTKNLNEQKAVVEFIVNSFEDFSEEIIFDEKPIIRKLPNIQHLWTPIKAKLKSNKSILSILKDIHPTPAICGVPWTNALVSIKQMETHSRGLFAGMIGWFNFENEGEFAVAIRSALAKEKNIYAFAGCGIVEGSDPELEYKEAELKLRPILSLFENEEVYQS